jgi:hypothetical protein
MVCSDSGEKVPFWTLGIHYYLLGLTQRVHLLNNLG